MILAPILHSPFCSKTRVTEKHTSRKRENLAFVVLDVQQDVKRSRPFPCGSDY